MKTKIFLILTIVFVFSLCVNATNITFTSSDSIVNGNVFYLVQVLNDGTTINMSGGQIYSLSTYNSSVFNMSGGQVQYSIHTGNLTTLNISGGTIVATNFEFGGNATISGGNITGNGKFVGHTVITGGNTNLSWLGIYGTLNISGGLLNVTDVYVAGSSPINISCLDYAYNPTTKILTGHLLDNNIFTIAGIDSSEYTKFNLIPEPMSVLLWGFGLLALRKSKK